MDFQKNQKKKKEGTITNDTTKNIFPPSLLLDNKSISPFATQTKDSTAIGSSLPLLPQFKSTKTDKEIEQKQEPKLTEFKNVGFAFGTPQTPDPSKQGTTGFSFYNNPSKPNTFNFANSTQNHDEAMDTNTSPGNQSGTLPPPIFKFGTGPINSAPVTDNTSNLPKITPTPLGNPTPFAANFGTQTNTHTSFSQHTTNPGLPQPHSFGFSGSLYPQPTVATPSFGANQLFGSGAFPQHPTPPTPSYYGNQNQTQPQAQPQIQTQPQIVSGPFNPNAEVSFNIGTAAKKQRKFKVKNWY